MNKNKYIAIFSAFYGFFIFGFIDSIKGAVLPEFLKNFNLNYSRGSDILIFNFLGFMVGTLITGFIVKIFGKNKLVIFSSFLIIIGIIGLTSTTSFILIKISLFLFGIGLGLMQVAGNSIIVDSVPHNKGKYLNLLTFYYGTGTIIASLYASILLSHYFNWKGVYQLSLVLPATLLIFSILVIFLSDKKPSFENNETNTSYYGKGIIKIDVLLLAGILCFDIAAEIGIASWMVEFLNKNKNFTIGKSTFYLSLFFMLLTIGRLLGSFLVERIAYTKILFCAISFAILFIFLGIFLPPIFAVLLPATGFCFSVIFPTTIALASDRYKKNIERILSILLFSGSIGGMIGPWLIGKISYISNLSIGLAMIGVFCILIFVALSLLSIFSMRLQSNTNVYEVIKNQ